MTNSVDTQRLTLKLADLLADILARKNAAIDQPLADILARESAALDQLLADILAHENAALDEALARDSAALDEALARWRDGLDQPLDNLALDIDFDALLEATREVEIDAATARVKTVIQARNRQATHEG